MSFKNMYMAIELPTMFKKTNKANKAPSIFEELGIDDASLLKEETSSNNFLSEFSGKKIFHAIEKFTHHKTLAISGYVLLALFLIVQVGGFFVFQSSIDNHTAILNEKKQMAQDMSIEIAKLEKQIGENKKKLDKKEVAKTLIKDRIETEQVFIEFDSILDILKNQNIFINIEYYDIQAVGTSSIQGFASRYRDVASFIELLEKNPHFTEISFSGLQQSQNNESSALPIDISFVFQEVSDEATNELNTEKEITDTTTTS